VVFAVRNECAKTLNDILFRRTGIGTLGNPGEGVLRLVVQTAAKELNWSAARIKEELAMARKAFVIPGHDDKGGQGRGAASVKKGVRHGTKTKRQ